MTTPFALAGAVLAIVAAAGVVIPATLDIRADGRRRCPSCRHRLRKHRPRTGDPDDGWQCWGSGGRQPYVAHPDGERVRVAWTRDPFTGDKTWISRVPWCKCERGEIPGGTP